MLFYVRTPVSKVFLILFWLLIAPRLLVLIILLLVLTHNFIFH